MTPVAVPAAAPVREAASAAGGGAVSAAGRGAALPVAPGRAELCDAALTMALTLIGIIGFRNAYGGIAYLVAGASGVILGLALSHLGQRARVPLLGITAIGVLAFVLLGGLVSAGIGNAAIPTLATMHAVLLAAVTGWKQLLTTAQPVGATAHLLALPYLLGIASGVTGHALARRTRTVLLPAAPPAGVVSLSILFGASQASAAAIQGAGFAALALAWAAIRQQRGIARLTTIGRQRPWQRLGAATAVLAIAAGGAVFLGPRLPGAAAHQRVVLHAVPPFNVDTYPSPLAGFRDYTPAADDSVRLYGKLLLSTSGLPAGAWIRIATMDSYDGTAWGVANAQAGQSSFAGFQSVGATLPGQAGAATGAGASAGPARSATITIEAAYAQPWLPSLPAATSIRFTGPRAAAVQGALRYNVATGTGVVPRDHDHDVLAGLRYTVTAPQAALSAGQLRTATPFQTPDLTGMGIQVWPAVTTFATMHAGGAGSQMAKVMALASYLQANGHFSDGGSQQAQVFAGHDEGRLTAFLQSDLTGDDEQYAAAMALLANAVGVPARVTLDASVEQDGSVYGKDVHANVELDLAQYGWVTLPDKDFTGNKKPVPQPKKTPQPQPAKAVPQQQPNAAPLTGNSQGSAASRGAPPLQKSSGFHVPPIVITLLAYAGIPLAVVVAIVAGLLGAKGARRRHRRAGPAVARVNGAWAELVDLGRDLGIAPQPGLTRREQGQCFSGGYTPTPQAPQPSGLPAVEPGSPGGTAETARPHRGSPGRSKLRSLALASPREPAAVIPQTPQAPQASVVCLPGAVAVAVAADAAIFGAGDPGPAVADNVWGLVAQARRDALAGLPRWRRAWVAINPASLLAGLAARRSRPARPPAPGPAAERRPELVPAMPGSLQ
jgi:hypothetical protein